MARVPEVAAARRTGSAASPALASAVSAALTSCGSPVVTIDVSLPSSGSSTVSIEDSAAAAIRESGESISLRSATVAVSELIEPSADTAVLATV